MDRILVIDQDRTATEQLRLECERRGVTVRIVENLCEAVRALVAEAASLIVVDAASLRLDPRAHAALFDQVAPGVPVVVTAETAMTCPGRAGLEQAGFRVATRALVLDVLSAKTVSP